MNVTQPVGGVVSLRKKGASARSWLVLDSAGQEHELEAGKHEIMRRTGLPARDLRILDPVLTYPSNVLGRERAIVVNLEHIKAIITAQEVLFLNSRDPLVAPFVKKLRGIILQRQAYRPFPQNAGVGIDTNNNASVPNLYDPEAPQPSLALQDKDRNEEGNEQQVSENPHGLKLLPFEFIALEACLETACSSLDTEARGLEQEAHPALDKLTSKISTLNLERVRQIKSRLVAITGRVQKVRDELEHLLDDDKDMAEMYLTEKLEQQNLERSSASSISELDDLLEDQMDPPDEHSRTPGEITMRHNNSTNQSETEQIMGEHPILFRRESHRTVISAHSTSMKRLDVEELEMILEAYFVQIEGSLNRLSTLREYVDDTEDYINIMLDDKQNHLLKMGVVLTTATVVVSAFVALTGVFGMNITIDLFDPDKYGDPEFLWTVGGGTIGCVALFVAALVWYKQKRLLE